LYVTFTFTGRLFFRENTLEIDSVAGLQRNLVGEGPFSSRQSDGSDNNDFRMSEMSGITLQAPDKTASGQVIADLLKKTDLSFVVSDDDLTMLEVGDVYLARVLMCKMHLRPPMPVGLPQRKSRTLSLTPSSPHESHILLSIN
jgi:hypothetical protein